MKKGINKTASLRTDIYPAYMGGGEWKWVRDRRKKCKWCEAKKKKRLSCYDDLCPQRRIINTIICTCGSRHAHHNLHHSQQKVTKWDPAGLWSEVRPPLRGAIRAGDWQWRTQLWLTPLFLASTRAVLKCCASPWGESIPKSRGSPRSAVYLLNTPGIPGATGSWNTLWKKHYHIGLKKK